LALFLITSGILAIVVVCTLASVAKADVISEEDFVHKASVANKFEIESSKLALDKSQNGQIKKFAQHMVDDHTKTAKTLEETLTSADVNVTPANHLDDKHQKLLAELQSLSGVAFDKRYIDLQTTAHKKAVKLFSDYSKNGKNQALKNFASDTLPALKKHLKYVQKLQAHE